MASPRLHQARRTTCRNCRHQYSVSLLLSFSLCRTPEITLEACLSALSRRWQVFASGHFYRRRFNISAEISQPISSAHPSSIILSQCLPVPHPMSKVMLSGSSACASSLEKTISSRRPGFSAVRRSHGRSPGCKEGVCKAAISVAFGYPCLRRGSEPRDTAISSIMPARQGGRRGTAVISWNETRDGIAPEIRQSRKVATARCAGREQHPAALDGSHCRPHPPTHLHNQRFRVIIRPSRPRAARIC